MRGGLLVTHQLAAAHRHAIQDRSIAVTVRAHKPESAHSLYAAGVGSGSTL